MTSSLVENLVIIGFVVAGVASLVCLVFLFMVVANKLNSLFHVKKNDQNERNESMKGVMNL